MMPALACWLVPALARWLVLRCAWLVLVRCVCALRVCVVLACWLVLRFACVRAVHSFRGLDQGIQGRQGLLQAMPSSWSCPKCSITVNPGSSNASECAVSVLVQYAVHLHVAPLAAHLRYEKWSLDFIFFVFCAGGKTRQPFLPPACRTILKGLVLYVCFAHLAQIC